MTTYRRASRPERQRIRTAGRAVAELVREQREAGIRRSGGHFCSADHMCGDCGCQAAADQLDLHDHADHRADQGDLVHWTKPPSHHPDHALVGPTASTLIGMVNDHTDVSAEQLDLALVGTATSTTAAAVGVEPAAAASPNPPAEGTA